ncbi:hypothetical protein ACFVXG_38525 [Kitasatospora sp. NPDC058162]|uniref:hypothetical protein n=1 Tax=Kitasatospora sp. NPDC058162 TaxID=3346362 RepID=UPI0036DA62E5
MPKHQTTAAQAARQDVKTGAKYTTALRTRRAAAPARTAVVRFLAQESGHLYELIGGIAAAWADTGLRVLLLEETDSGWRWTLPSGRRRQPVTRTEPEPVTVVLWEQLAGPGTLVHHTCVWDVWGPGDRGMPVHDRTALRTAVAAAREAYDIVVLLPDGSWSYPERELATASIAAVDLNDFPHTDCRVAVPGTYEHRGAPLSPEQCAAVLRERHLSFLYGFGLAALPIEPDGLIWQLHGKAPVDDDYLQRVDRDMARVGLRTLGWATTEPLPLRPRRGLPTPEQLASPDFVGPHREIAARLRQVPGVLPL